MCSLFFIKLSFFVTLPAQAQNKKLYLSRPLNDMLLESWNSASELCSDNSLSNTQFRQLLKTIIKKYNEYKHNLPSQNKEKTSASLLVKTGLVLGFLAFEYYYFSLKKNLFPQVAHINTPMLNSNLSHVVLLKESDNDTASLPSYHAQELINAPSRAQSYSSEEQDNVIDYNLFEKKFGISPHSPEWNPSHPLCKKIISSYDLYHDPLFLSLLRTVPGYNEHISYLRKEIDTKNSPIRKALKHVPGFEGHTYYGWSGGIFGSKKSFYKFHDFIRAEDDRIKQEQKHEEIKEKL